jgi:hypothetical protein
VGEEGPGRPLPPLPRAPRPLGRRLEAALKERIAQAVNEAIAAAEQHGPPADETLVTDVFAHVPPQLREQLAQVLALEGRGVNEGAFPL